MNNNKDKRSISPWEWTDGTIINLSTELTTIRNIIRNTPNDQELGRKLRERDNKTGEIWGEHKNG
jgi:hypothetical protein|tara:strand:- start:1648 stop:1842 length:195 start_codon:yes stop_codon:yes gene_type:complete